MEKETAAEQAICELLKVWWLKKNSKLGEQDAKKTEYLGLVSEEAERLIGHVLIRREWGIPCLSSPVKESHSHAQVLENKAKNYS